MWDFLDKWLFGIDQEEDIENFLKRFPEIDIRKIIEKVDIFNQIVKDSDLEKIEHPALLVDEDLKKDVKQAVALSNFLGTYSFRSIFPLNNYIDLLQDDTVKVSMRYRKRMHKSKHYFSYYLIFKQFEYDWIIVESSLLYNLQWRKRVIQFVSIALFIVVVLSMKEKFYLFL